MGTKMAPTYATLVLGYLEHILYEQLLNSYGQEFASYVMGVSIFRENVLYYVVIC
jgi:hypothetical protein